MPTVTSPKQQENLRQEKKAPKKVETISKRLHKASNGSSPRGTRRTTSRSRARL